MVKNYTTTSFRIPEYIAKEQQVEYCKKIIINLRQELQPLRKQVSVEQKLQKQWKEQVEYWKQKYQKQQEDINEVLKEMEKLKKEQERLKKQIEKLTKTQNRYQISLFDHGNFKRKDNQEGKKSLGGQAGHADTNRENQATFTGYDSFERKRIWAKACGRCGTDLPRVKATRQKLLLDIKLNPQITKLLIDQERQWCGVCKKEVNAQAETSLPFSEYGLNTLIMVMVLRGKAHTSMEATSKILELGFGLTLSKSDISNLLKQSAKYLGKRYEELKTAVRKGEVMYNDETGWQVKGKSAWMWIMATEDEVDRKGKLIQSGVTVYVAAESRGKGIMEDMYGASQAYSMHDGYAGYINTTPREKQLNCWAHVGTVKYFV